MAITEWDIRKTVTGQDDVQIVLCDDDPRFLESLGGEILRIFAKRDMNIRIAAFSSPGEIPKQWLAQCDMAFFDIDFENLETNGIDAARSLRQLNSRALIFFVTNYIDYAPAGYEVQAFRYILKRDITDVLERYLLQAMEHFAAGHERLRLHGRDGMAEIPLNQIIYLEVMDHCVSIHTQGETYSLNTTLSSMDAGLQEHGFLRIHKSFLVNMCYIRKFRSRECLLTDGTSLAVSEKNYSMQKQKYLLWKGLR